VFERLVAERPLLAEDEGVGLPGVLEVGLGQPAAGAAAKQPLQLARLCPAQAEARGEPLEGPLLGGGERLQLGAGDRARTGDSGKLLNPPPSAIEAPQMPLRGLLQRDA
jgi:hypothetical protein